MKTRLLLSASAAFILSVSSYGQYCTTGLYGSGCQYSDDIGNFTLNLINNTTTNCTPDAYEDFTSISDTLLPSTTYPFSALSNYGCCQHLAIWIDENNDGDFDDPGEHLYSSQTSAGTFSGTITTPANAGTFRLRVRGKYSGSPMTATDACTYYSYGEIEDYTVFIDYLSPNDAGIVQLDSPATPACALGNNVYATIGNFGSDTLTSAVINWEINGTPQTPVNWTGSLASFQNEMVMLGTSPIANGDDIKVWTSLPNGSPESPGAEVNDTLDQNVQTGLSGTYFITCLGLPNTYATFTDAVNDLVAFGVCGPVQFVVDNCVFNEQIVIPEILNVNATDTVLFRSVNGTPAGCELTYTPTGTADNYTIHLDGADHISFENMTISTGAVGSYNGKVIVIDGGASYNRIDSCLVIGDPSTTSSWGPDVAVISSDADIDSNNYVTGNTISGGSYGIYFYGSSTTGLEESNVFAENELVDYYYGGFNLYYQNDVAVSNNTMTPLVGGYAWGNYHLDLNYCNGASMVNGNHIAVDQDGYGISIYECTAEASNPGLIYNNSIGLGDSLGNNASTGMEISYSSNQLVHSNSIFLMTQYSYGEGVYVYGGFNNKMFNNNIYVEGPAPAIYFGGGLTESNYNNLYSTGGDLVDFNGNMQATLTDWYNATGFDLNSYNVNPLYVSASDLSTCNDTLDNAGVAHASIMDDFHGNMRSSTFDVGAIEFDGISSFTLGADTNICAGSTLTIGNPNSTSAWLWNTGPSTNTIDVTAAGTYVAQITSVCGVGSATIDVGIEPATVASFTFNPIYMGIIFTNTSTNGISYHWDFGDGDTSNLENPDHVYTVEGTYTVTLTVTGPCGTETITQDVHPNPLSIGEESIAFSILPNPATDNVTIQSSEVMNGSQIEIVDATGRVVYRDVQTASVINLDVSVFETGAYFVRIINEEKIGIQKLIIE